MPAGHNQTPMMVWLWECRSKTLAYDSDSDNGQHYTQSRCSKFKQSVKKKTSTLAEAVAPAMVLTQCQGFCACNCRLAGPQLADSAIAAGINCWQDGTVASSQVIQEGSHMRVPLAAHRQLEPSSLVEPVCALMVWSGCHSSKFLLVVLLALVEM